MSEDNEQSMGNPDYTLAKERLLKCFQDFSTKSRLMKPQDLHTGDESDFSDSSCYGRLSCLLTWQKLITKEGTFDLNNPPIVTLMSFSPTGLIL